MLEFGIGAGSSSNKSSRTRDGFASPRDACAPGLIAQRAVLIAAHLDERIRWPQSDGTREASFSLQAFVTETQGDVTDVVRRYNRGGR